MPNDVTLTGDELVHIITGPNMSGKSTFLRQVALIVLMAQIGSFVPAEHTRLGIVDRIFTRIGAEDAISAGQSTFMVEMVETANILHHCTPRSLVVLDEIGRGTSTYDGIAIARAIIEYLHNHPQAHAKTLFATHYHELTELESYLPRVKNYNVAVIEQGDQVVFMHKIVPGGADKSVRHSRRTARRSPASGSQSRARDFARIGKRRTHARTANLSDSTTPIFSRRRFAPGNRCPRRHGLVAH